MGTLGVFLYIYLSFSVEAMIYGIDDREPVTDAGPYSELARSTAISVLSSLYSRNDDGTIKLNVDTLGGYICSEENFARDYSLAYSCTGFLAAPDLLVTAGHCMVNTGQSRNQTQTYCQAFAWLFDYKGDVGLKNIPPGNFFKCKQVVYSVRDEQAPFRDFAIVQLERPVPDRRPLKWADVSPVEGDTLSMIGYPLGSPAKVSRNARVLLNNFKHQHFVASLDAFEGNSGSPVFNANREVVGILVGAVPHVSLIENAERGCSQYNRCDEEGLNCAKPDADTALFPEFQRPGAMVQKAGPIRDLLLMRSASAVVGRPISLRN